MWFRKSGASSGADNAERLREMQERAAQTQAALQRGELPGPVLDRMRRERAGELPWTSDLSVNEWHLLHEFRFRPLGQVMGSCFYHIGYALTNTTGVWYDVDIPEVERALLEGRRRALQRMQQEAAALGANAVVGVRTRSDQPGFYGHETEFVCFGTAVRMEGLEPSPHPVLCTVTGQSLAKLLAAGSFPVGVAMGVCVHYQYTSQGDEWSATSWYNQEVGAFTDAVYHTRNRAVRSMMEETKGLGGKGVLAHETSFSVRGVKVERDNSGEREDHILEFISIGTAVSETKVPIPVRPELVLDLGR